jgi:amino acid transporter
MNVIAVVGLRWISRSARAGVPSISLWLLAWLFFVPFAAAVIEFSRRYPEQGGLYVWVKRALGPLHGFIAGWSYCLNFAFYYVTFLLFAAANVAAVLGERGAGLADDRTYSIVFVLVLLGAHVRQRPRL